MWPSPGKELLEEVDRAVRVTVSHPPTVQVPTAIRPLPQGHRLPLAAAATVLGSVPLFDTFQSLPSMQTLVVQHLHQGVHAPVIEHRPVASAVLLLVGLGDHLTLGEIAHHHGTFNQSVGEEV